MKSREKISGLPSLDAEQTEAITIPHMVVQQPNTDSSQIPSTTRHQQSVDNKDEREAKAISVAIPQNVVSNHTATTSNPYKCVNNDNKNLEQMEDELIVISRNIGSNHQQNPNNNNLRVEEMEDEVVATFQNIESSYIPPTGSYQQRVNSNSLEEMADEVSQKKPKSNHRSTTSCHPQNVNDNMEGMEDQFVEILSRQLLDNLQQFAHQQHRADHDVDCHGQFVIGSVQDKNKRKIIRQYIGSLYPHLQTILQCNDEDKVIIVKSNPSYNEFRKSLPEHQVDELMRFINKTHVTKAGSYAIDVVDLSKDQRRQLHHRISHLYGKFIESKTVTKMSRNISKNYVVVRYKSRIQNSRDDNNPLYLKFILRKRNIETLDALHRMAKVLRCRLSDFSYAGIKDCRAITYQQVTVKNMTPKQMIHGLQKMGRQQNIEYGHYQFSHGPIKLGQLQGNRFRIVLRYTRLLCHDLCTKRSTNLQYEVIQSMEEVQHKGFINYFGSQRFGNAVSNVNTYDIGLAMLRKDEKMAVELILSSVVEDHKDSEVATALKYYRDSGDLAGTVIKMSSSKSRQILLLKALHRYGQDSTGYRKALLSIPYNMRKMYIHSYCSLLWNRLVNYRIQTYGYDVIEGDLVFTDNGKEQLDDNTASMIDRDQQVKRITKEDLAQCRYNIYDVVLPLLGSKTILPGNTLGPVYQEMLTKDGITHHSFINPQLDIKIKGAYRKILCIPKDVVYSLHHLNCQHLHNDCHDCCANTIKNQSFKQCCDDDQRFHFKLEMTLNPGSYATILLREITNNNDIVYS